MNLPPRSPYARHWDLDPEVVFLNHGSFGACPRQVLAVQAEWRALMERQPVRFLHRRLEAELDRARAALGAFVGADPDDLAFVANATTGVNTVLRSLALEPGDEVITTDHDYNACRNALVEVTRAAGARIVVAGLPLPIAGEDQVVEAVLAAVSERTRLALIDHVTSPTGLVLPVRRIVAELRERGVDTLIDGAHAPGMLELDIAAIGPAYYTGNCHKWLCAPKGAALLYVRRDLQQAVRPLVISHGANSPRRDRPRFRLEFDFTGTADYTPFLSVPAAIEVMGSMRPGGWPELRQHNADLARHARRHLVERLGTRPLAPEAMLGSLATIELPAAGARRSPGAADPLQAALADRYRIEVPVWPWGSARLLRVSAQLYNSELQYEYLAGALVESGLSV